MNSYLGIDVSKAWLDVLLLREALPVEKGHFDNSQQGFRQLQHFLKKRKIKMLHACLEATGYYGAEVALFLHEAGYVVSVVNPARIKAYAESQLNRTKTDAGDAALIADFCRTQQPEAWTPPPLNSRNCKPWCVIWKTCKTCVNKKSIVVKPVSLLKLF